MRALDGISITAVGFWEKNRLVCSLPLDGHHVCSLSFVNQLQQRNVHPCGLGLAAAASPGRQRQSLGSAADGIDRDELCVSVGFPWK
jgi:hypothetical protein